MKILEQSRYMVCTPTAIVHSMVILQPSKVAGRQYFFVVFTPPYYHLDAFERQPGYDAVFMLPSESLGADETSWDIAMYDSGSHEAMAGIQWRDDDGH